MTHPHTGPAVAAPDLEAAIAVLRERGLRVSAARRLVLESLYAAGEPVSAERIADGLGGHFPPSDLPSVYRNLETLESAGLVRHFHLGHGPGLYVPAGEQHEYLLCETCRRLRVIEPAELDEARELIHARLGFRARFTHFPVVGVCEDCEVAR